MLVLPSVSSPLAFFACQALRRLGLLKRNAPIGSSLPCRHGKMTTHYTHVPPLTLKLLSVLILAFALSVLP